MAKKPTAIPEELRAWIEARSRFGLSHAQVQMARELGMNPRKLGGKANHAQEPWKLPLPEFIAHLYVKRFGREKPDTVLSIEEIAAARRAKKQAKRLAKEQRRQSGGGDQASSSQS